MFALVKRRVIHRRLLWLKILLLNIIPALRKNSKTRLENYTASIVKNFNDFNMFPLVASVPIKQLVH